MKFKDQILLEHAYYQVYLKESILPENLKLKVNSFVSRHGQKVKNFIQSKFPDFYQKLVATNGDEQKIRDLVTPLVNSQSTNNPVQEEGLKDMLGAAGKMAKDVFDTIFTHANIGAALIAAGTVSLGLGDALASGPGMDRDLLIAGIIAILLGIWNLFIKEKN
jgi:hypothetical protein